MRQMKFCVIVDRQTPRDVHVAVFALQLSATLHPQDLPSFAFNVALMAREGLTGGTQLMAATVSVSNMVPRLFVS